MPRSRVKDLMLTHRFWLMDVVPSATFPFLVLGTPFMGFQSITSPEYTAEMVEIKELNSMYKKYGYGGGAASPITLTRGVRGYDETMWNWMQMAIRGNDMTNRHLVLLHFTSMAMPVGGDSDLPFDAWETRPFLPGKAWLLWDCLPTRYKAASDFDATSSSVSISELEIQPQAITEMTLLDPT